MFKKYAHICILNLYVESQKYVFFSKGTDMKKWKTYNPVKNGYIKNIILDYIKLRRIMFKLTCLYLMIKNITKQLVLVTSDYVTYVN